MPQNEKRKKDEQICVHRLCKVLQSHQQVLAVTEDLRPGCSSPLRAKWDNMTGGYSLKLQPQIDILLEDLLWRYLCGIEVKYFKKPENHTRFNWAFYAGIDEAIAMLNYGFHTAAVWHVFSPNTTKQDLDHYGAPFWQHMDKLGLPIEYTMMIDRGEDFDVYNRDRKTGKSCPLCRLSQIALGYSHFNPIFDEPHQKELRKIIYEWCLGQHQRRYKNKQHSDSALSLATGRVIPVFIP
jgi:hypothetical protein